MKPLEFLKLAQTLAEKGDEASLRTAISRAYYALFHNALGVLRSFGENVPSDSRAHSEIPKRLRKISLKERNELLRELADQLDSLRKIRRDADYRLRAPIPSKDCVQYYINRAKEIKKMI